MEANCIKQYLVLILMTFIQFSTSIRVYDVKANPADIGSQTAVISWTTDTTTDSLNSTIRGFRIDANYLLSKRGNEILNPDITNTTIKRLRSGVTYRACVIVLITNSKGNGELQDNTACVSFTTDFVAINSYSLTAIFIGVAIIALFLITQLINVVCPRKGSEAFVPPPRRKSQSEMEEGDNEPRRKSCEEGRSEPKKAKRSGKQKRKKKQQPSGEPERKQHRDKDKRQKEISRRSNLDGSKGGGGKHKSVKA